jgi:hypothetical protein
MGQPGAVACVATLLAMSVGAAGLGARSAASWLLQGINLWSNELERPYYFWLIICSNVIYIADLAGLGIITTWLTLGLGRRLRPEPGWLDRTGRLIGGLWIFAALVSYAFTLTEIFPVTPPLPPPLPPAPPQAAPLDFIQN